MISNSSRIQSALDEIFNLYEKHGADAYIGESISQIEHACQCAQLAEKNGCDATVILAAFFHDIGHLCANDESGDDMDGYGQRHHEKMGADFLRQRGFPEKIARLVESHVQAKRYLCAAKPDYYRKLSEASKQTLKHQGGPLTESEAAEFRSHPLFEEMIQLRAWDEAAKMENVPLPDSKVYREMAKNILEKTNEN